MSCLKAHNTPVVFTAKERLFIDVVIANNFTNATAWLFDCSFHTKTTGLETIPGRKSIPYGGWDP